MLKKLLVALSLWAAIANHPALALFEEGKDELLKGIQVKKIRQNYGYEFSVNPFKRKFKMLSVSTGPQLWASLDDNASVKGIWNPLLKEWIFMHAPLGMEKDQKNILIFSVREIQKDSVGAKL